MFGATIDNYGYFVIPGQAPQVGAPKKDISQPLGQNDNFC